MEKRRSDSKAILLNIIWAVLAILVKYAINFLTTPYVTNNIGVEAYGFVSLANTFIPVLPIIAAAPKAPNVKLNRFFSISINP